MKRASRQPLPQSPLTRLADLAQEIRNEAITSLGEGPETARRGWPITKRREVQHELQGLATAALTAGVTAGLPLNDVEGRIERLLNVSKSLLQFGMKISYSPDAVARRATGWQAAFNRLEEFSEEFGVALESYLRMAVVSAAKVPNFSMVWMPATKAAELSELLGYPISVSRICKLSKKDLQPFPCRPAPESSEHKLEVGRHAFIDFVLNEKEKKAPQANTREYYAEVEKRISEERSKKKSRGLMDLR
jgi:hypothetical protein